MTQNKDLRVRMTLALAFAHVGVFAKYFLPEYVSAPFGKHHDPLFRAIGRGETGKQMNILAPRGSAKSTCMAVIYPLHCIFFKWAYEKLGMKPHNFIVIVSKSHTMAKSRVQDIKRKIDRDVRFKEVVGDATWGEQRLITDNQIMIVPNSRGGQIRGSLFGAERPDLIISDDLDDPETVRNPAVREKDQLWFDSDFIRAGRPDGKTNFINIDTVKHAESTANLLRQRSGWDTKFFQAIEYPADLWHPTAERLWQEWEKLYTDMDVEETERHTQAQAFYAENEGAMMADVEELWPEVITYLAVRKEVCDVGYYPVLRELQNSTHDPSQALFDMASAMRFEKTKEGFLRADKRLIRWEEMAGATVFLDWAGGKDIADNAFAAVVSVIWVPLPGSRQDKTDSLMDGVHGYVFSAELKRAGATEQIAMCFDAIQQIRREIPKPDLRLRLGVEGFVQDTWQAQKQVIERDYRAQREARNVRDYPVLEFLTRQRNKFDRIDALQPIIRNGWLSFAKGLPGEFMKQMSLYPTGDFVDGPDALEGACELRVSRFESERRERRERVAQRNRNFKVRV
ncbi:MAG: hypothetical protein OYL97_08510 [Candidatus Poribacteria bacterium]|nr:hypothetical protein [Candidatus Poribacteria bacterium]